MKNLSRTYLWNRFPSLFLFSLWIIERMDVDIIKFWMKIFLNISIHVFDQISNKIEREIGSVSMCTIQTQLCRLNLL